MRIDFWKYQGTGNDFVMIDNRKGSIIHNAELAQKLCNRKFGIGSDGLILLQKHPDCDFEMVFYNPDGSQSFCGNGSRCAVHFANLLGLIENEASFLAIDGTHSARIMGETVEVQMNDVSDVEVGEDYYFVDTGSPHYIMYVDDVDAINVVQEARKIRYNERFSEQGTNVNFVQKCDGYVKMRTYERGVEGETLSCGTGVTAVALSARLQELCANECEVSTLGGKLKVKFKAKEDQSFSDVWLIGPAQQVFQGKIEL